MLRTLLGYILPRPKDPPVKTGPLRMGTVEELAQTFASILKKTSSGQLQLSDTQAIAALIETRRRIIETHELASLMGELERLCQQDK